MVESENKPIFQNADFLIGRICLKDIVNFNNEILIKANSIVNKKSVYEKDDLECEIRQFVITESINFLIKLIENKIDMTKVAKAIMI